MTIQIGGISGTLVILCWVASLVLLLFGGFDSYPEYSDLLENIAYFLTLLGLVLPIWGLHGQFQKSIEANERVLRENERMLDEISKSGVVGNEEVRIVVPKNIDDFKSVFQNATKVLAYNPPLDLLVTNERHREVILNVLKNPLSEYKLISGRTVTERLCNLRKVFYDDYSAHPEKVREPLSRMEIIHFDHEADLHSEVTPWEIRRSDMRGLSFFLVEKPNNERVVLLYILGMPFVRSFDVPRKAISISKTSEDYKEFELFTQMYEEFETRWGELHSLAMKTRAATSAGLPIEPGTASYVSTLNSIVNETQKVAS